MALEHAVLRALDGAPAHGLVVIERVNTAEGRKALHQGNAYPLLRQLERDGFLSCDQVPGPPERGGRPRFVYTVTGAGRDRLREPEQLPAGELGLAPA